MKSYLAYIRVSTVKQGEHGSSLQEQRSAIEAYAARHGLAIAQWFEETETAAKQGRREFMRLTSLLRQGKASGVIIHKIDRSARNLKDWAGLGELIDAGIEVLFAHEGLDMQTRGGRLAADIQAVVAADFIRNLRDEVRKGFYGRLKQGYYPLQAPRGYVDRGRARIKDIHPIDGPLVQQAFELYGTGNYSLELLRIEMAQRGLITASGNTLSFNGIAKMLHNPFYIGLIRIHKTNQIFQGNHTPLVTKALFDRVQAILSGRQYPRIEKHQFTFRRLVKCAGCSRSLTGERQKGHVYYRCHDRGCKGVSVNEDTVDGIVGHELAALSFEGRDLGDMRDLFREQVELEEIRQGRGEDKINCDIALNEQRITRLTDALIDGTIDKSTYEERKCDLLGRRKTLQDRLQSGEDSTFWRDVLQKFELGLTAYSSYFRGNDAEKRETVQLVSSNLLVRGKEPYFTMHFPFEEIRNWSKSSSCEPDGNAVRTLDLARKPVGGHRGPRLSDLVQRLAERHPDANRAKPNAGNGTNSSPRSPRSPQVLAAIRARGTRRKA